MFPLIEVASLKAIYKFLLKTKQIQQSCLKHKALKTAKVLQIPFSEKEVAEVLDQIQSRWFEEVRNKLIIDLFYNWNTTNGVNSFENM
jgi:integrase/recombinase XerC